MTGTIDLGGNGLIEPGNPLFPVRRYTATLTGTAVGDVAPSGPPTGAPIPPPVVAPPTTTPATPTRVLATFSRRVLPRRTVLVVRGFTDPGRAGARAVMERRVGGRFVPLCATRVRSNGRFARGCRVDGLARARAILLRLRVRVIGPGDLAPATGAVAIRRIPRTPAR